MELVAALGDVMFCSWFCRSGSRSHATIPLPSSVAHFNCSILYFYFNFHMIFQILSFHLVSILFFTRPSRKRLLIRPVSFAHTCAAATGRRGTASGPDRAPSESTGHDDGTLSAPAKPVDHQLIFAPTTASPSRAKTALIFFPLFL